MKIKKPSIALIGSGYWGKNLARNFYELGALDLICDGKEIILQDAAYRYNGIDTCFSTIDVFKRDDIDAVVIATPPETHFDMARKALMAGKHVFVEKPLVLNEVEGERLVALATSHKKVLMVGHLLQYHPVFVKLKQLALSGKLGRINYIYSHRLNLGKIRRHENALWSFAPHDISMILALAQDDPVSVIATGGNYLHEHIADVTTSHLEFASGLRAHIFVSWLHPFKEQKLVVVGDRKMAVFDDTLPWEDKLLLYSHQISWVNNIPITFKAEAERICVEQAEPLRQECLHFLDCISNGTAPITDGEEGLRVLRVLNAGQTSLNNFSRRIDSRNKIGSSRKDPDTDTDTDTDTTNTDIFIHSSAVIDDKVIIGDRTKIWHFSHVLPGSKIGKDCNIGQNVVIGPDVSIGSGCKIQNNVSIYKGVTLKNDVFCGPSVVFTNIYNPRAEIRKMDQVRPTLVKKGATIGANATIVCGTRLGRYCFIGAGAVVNKDVPDYALMVGNPAKQIGWSCDCGEKLTGDLECNACGKKFQMRSNKSLFLK